MDADGERPASVAGLRADTTAMGRNAEEPARTASRTASRF